MDKKRILICIDWYEPGFKAGGPIRSVANIVNALKDDFEFYILTSAYDLGETDVYPDVPLNEWYDQDGVFLKYLDHTLLNSGSIRRNVLEINPDMLYLNSLFSQYFTLVPLLTAKRKGTPVILAPRGMLGEASLDIKRKKKKGFLLFSKLIGIYKKVTWHASTESEAQHILHNFSKKAKIKIAQNIPVGQKLKLDYILDKKKTGTVRFLFVSRIAEIKNLHLVVKAMKRLKITSDVSFHVYGNIEDEEYYSSFKDEFGTFGQLSIVYKGLIPPSDLPDVFANSDFLVLPTKHENYGHAIVEAWSNACPVIISRNTPWRNLNVQNLGWDVDVENIDNLVEALQEAVDLDFTSYIAQCTASYNYFKDVISDEDVISANRNLFADEN